jgi:hypothetical protein
VDKIFDKEIIKPKGTWCSTPTPETLDLAWHAKKAVNYLTRSVESGRGYTTNPRLTFGRQAPTVMWQLQVIPTGITPFMNLRALPLMRIMCGETEGLDIELEMMKSHLHRINENGLLIYPEGDAIIPKGSCYPNANGFTGLALANWYSRDGNQIWLDKLALLAAGLRQIAIKKNDYAYYPPESGVDENGVWHSSPNVDRLLLTKPFVDYDPPNEPVKDQLGYLGNSKYAQAGPLMALLADYRLNENQQSLIMARKIAAFCLKPKLWENNVQGNWAGYFQGNITVLQALLQLALIDNDEKTIEMVKKSYEMSRQRGISSIGWFPYWSPRRAHGFPDTLSTWCETCSVAKMLILAIDLSNAGVEDYWDDVDCYIRNQLIEQQFVNLDLMRQVSSSGGPPIEVDKLQDLSSNDNNVLERFLGGFGGGEVDTAGLIYMDKNAVIDHCCSTNGAIALYHAWNGITTDHNDVAIVNLFLNRVSKWLDIVSYLPYEGKVVINNKTSREIRIRLPKWLSRNTVKCFVNNKRINTEISANHLICSSLKAGDMILLEFAIPISTQSFKVDNNNYKLYFKASTATEIRGRRPEDPYIYPIYKREKLKLSTSPIKNEHRFISDNIINPS